MSEVHTLAHRDLTLPGLYGEASASEFEQHILDMTDMVFPVGALDYHIVQVGGCVIDTISQYDVHHLLERGWGFM